MRFPIDSPFNPGLLEGRFLFAIGVIMVTNMGNIDLDAECVLYGEIATTPLDPWIIAQERPESASREGFDLPILFATGEPLAFSHWSLVRSIDVEEFHRSSWETRCEFSRLQPVNPIWTGLDSVCLMPSIEQLRREEVEPIRVHRQFLDENLVRPYAICETPAFIGVADLAQGLAEQSGEETVGDD